MGKKAIVLGASSGIGREITKLLLSDGWQVGIGARRLQPLEEIRQQTPEQVRTASIDVCVDEAPQKLYELIDALGGMDLFFYAPGIGKLNRELDSEIELAVVRTNALGFTRMMDAAWHWMAYHGGGHIAIISSVAGVRGLGPSPSYSATKALQHNYLQALEQLSNARRLGICFTEIRPGFIDTPLLGKTHFPLTMSLSYAAPRIYRAVMRRRHVAYIDWRWHLIILLWRLVPNCIWRRMKL